MAKQKNEIEENIIDDGYEEEIELKIIDYNLEDFSSLYDFLKKYKDNEDALKEAINANIDKIALRHHVDAYSWVFLYDENNSISAHHSNKIYNSIKNLKDMNKDIAMFLNSPGGSIEPAYLISKTCKRTSKSKFIVSIPRKAKSAATLISLGASEIHMGMMSELGPIDPQIGNFPALSMSNALEKIAETAAKHPEASLMFSEYLDKNLNLKLLGYFERINESAIQYAERLLSNSNINSNKSIEEISNHLVNHYKDHSFVIDFEEAKEILGSNIVKEDTNEYLFSNDIYQMFDMINVLLGYLYDKEFTFIGNSENGLSVKDIEKES